MRIVLVSPLPPLRDGIADYTAKLATAYRDAGHEVAAITAVDQPDATGAVTLGSVTWSPFGLWRVVRAVRRFGPDVVQVQHGIATYGPRLLPLWMLVLVSRLTGAHIVITHHEVTRDVERLGLPGRLYYRAVSALAAVVHVHTVAAHRALVDSLGVPPERVLVRPHPVYDLPPAGVPGERLRERHGLDGKTVLLLFGFVHVEKGLRELVEGLGALVARDPSVADRLRLVVAGDVRPRSASFARFAQADRDYLDAVRDRAARDDVAGMVVFSGHVPEVEVAGWFAAADLAVLPYTNSEQSGVANLAIAAGTPVLASRTGGLGDLFAEWLPTFAALDAESVADALQVFLRDGIDPALLSDRYTELIVAGSPAVLAELIGDRLSLRAPVGRPA